MGLNVGPIFCLRDFDILGLLLLSLPSATAPQKTANYLDYDIRDD